MEALRRFTCYFSAEDAVRYFLNDFPQQTMQAVENWARDDDYRVRRLASESTRPLLPWSMRIRLPFDAALPILGQLHADPSRYVTQSVANHLRDISTTDPDLVLATLTRWQEEGRARPAELAFITREALKTKLRQGWPPAYDLLGFASDLPVEVTVVHLERDQLNDGDTLAFTADLRSPVSGALHVMYVITSKTRRGAQREKVYFLNRATVEAGQPLRLAKRHHLRSTATTKITPGPHDLQIQVNGQRFPATSFEVGGQMP